MRKSFWQWARLQPDAVALITPDDERVRAGALLDGANRLVRALRQRGLSAGDVVAMALRPGVELLEAYLAAMQAGWYLVPINPQLSPDEVAYLVRDSGARILLAHATTERLARDAAALAGLEPGAVLVAGVAGTGSLEALKAAHGGDPVDHRRAGQVMPYTSGTTGRPKGVRRPLGDRDPDEAAANFSRLIEVFGVVAGEPGVHLAGSALYHSAALMFATASLHQGHTLVLAERWSAEGFLATVARHRVTSTALVPTHFHRLLALPDEVRSGYDLQSLRCAVHAAAPCPVHIKRRMIEWWGPVLYEYYAASEGGGTAVTSLEWLRRPGTVGQPWPGAEVRILKEDGTRCAPGEVGTVYLAAHREPFEYHNDAAKTAAGRLDGLFTVGDVGYLDADGYLFLCDRKTDLVITGGMNVYPSEVEQALTTHGAVADAAVFGVPNDEWGEEVRAAVQLSGNESPSAALAQDLIELCRARIARYKCPRAIEFVERVPRDGNGKLLRRALRDPYWRAHERHI